jgi:hypothetical protein
MNLILSHASQAIAMALPNQAGKQIHPFRSAQFSFQRLISHPFDPGKIRPPPPADNPHQCSLVFTMAFRFDPAHGLGRSKL